VLFGATLKFIYSSVGKEAEHFARWGASDTYYVKCMDRYGNEPGPNQCSLIASAVRFNN